MMALAALLDGALVAAEAIVDVRPVLCSVAPSSRRQPPHADLDSAPLDVLAGGRRPRVTGLTAVRPDGHVEGPGGMRQHGQVHVLHPGRRPGRRDRTTVQRSCVVTPSAFTSTVQPPRLANTRMCTAFGLPAPDLAVGLLRLLGAGARLGSGVADLCPGLS